MLYEWKNVTVSLGGETVLSHVDFFIRGKEKIAIVGRNGAGKTTVLRTMAGELTPDADDRREGRAITTSRALTVGKLSQKPWENLEQTVQQMLEDSFRQQFPHVSDFSPERFTYETEFDRLFCGLGFDKDDKQRALKTFSGGQQTKLALIRLLLERPDILLLDEPTNHLDMAATEWLEDYLKEYPSAVVMVSHDRFFLDRVAEVTYELENHQLTRYTGGYTAYRQEKQKRLMAQQKEYLRYEEEKKRLEGLIERFKNKPHKASFARAKAKQLERMEVKKPPVQEHSLQITALEQPQIWGAKWVYEAEHLKIGYQKPLYELGLRIRRGQKIAVIGENGSGKTTLLKTIAGLLPPLAGKSTLGNQILLGYFDQKSGELQDDATVLEHFHQRFPALLEVDVRKKLAMWLFGGKDVGKKVQDLSGGEKARLVLAELLQGCPNFLVLDEPTNHMDIPAKETLEAVLQAYTGTQLLVSHDRYFLSRVADCLLLMDGKTVTFYPFGYEHYLERKKKAIEQEHIPGEMRAEDAALLNSVQNVPKKSAIQAHAMSTEEAYRDWQRRLADEQLENERLSYEEAMRTGETWEAWEIAEEAWLAAQLRWYDHYREANGEKD